jgi:hypothetical protein
MRVHTHTHTNTQVREKERALQPDNSTQNDQGDATEMIAEKGDDKTSQKQEADQATSSGTGKDKNSKGKNEGGEKPAGGKGKKGK